MLSLSRYDSFDLVDLSPNQGGNLTAVCENFACGRQGNLRNAVSVLTEMTENVVSLSGTILKCFMKHNFFRC